MWRLGLRCQNSRVTPYRMEAMVYKRHTLLSEAHVNLHREGTSTVFSYKHIHSIRESLSSKTGSNSDFSKNHFDQTVVNQEPTDPSDIFQQFLQIFILIDIGSTRFLIMIDIGSFVHSFLQTIKATNKVQCLCRHEFVV